jgi:hypothetical protein
LSISNFKIRADQELIELRDEVMSLATDSDIYWKVQRDVIQHNGRLLTMRSAFFDMLNDAYAHATASRIRRLVDRDSRTISLRRLVEELMSYPDAFEKKCTLRDLQNDLSSLDETCKRVKDYVDQFVAHHERNSTAGVPTFHELNAAIEKIIAVFKRCYSILRNTDTAVVVSYLEDPLAIFAFPWITDKSRTLEQMVSEITPQNQHPEVDWGPAVGREKIES